MLDEMEKYPIEHAPSRKLSTKFKILHYFAIAAVFFLFFIQHKWLFNFLFL
jgi:hypothetical protein